MAEKKNTASSGKKPGTDKKSGTKTPTVKNTTYNSSPIPAQIILGFICLGLFVLQLVGIFQREGTLLLIYRNVIMGLFGEVGFYFLLLALPYLFWVLVFMRKADVWMRCLSTLGVVLLGGISLQLMLPERTYEGFFSAIGQLYSGGAEGTSAGLVCGALGNLLRSVCGEIIAFILVLVLGCILLLRAMEITLGRLYYAIQNRPRDPELEREKEEFDAAAQLVNKITEKRLEMKRKRRLERIDEDYEDYYEEEQPKLPPVPKTKKEPKFFDFDKNPPAEPVTVTARPSNEKLDKVMRQMEEEIDTPMGTPSSENEPEETIIVPEKPVKEKTAAPKEESFVIPNSMPEFKREDPIPGAPKTEAKKPKPVKKQEDGANAVAQQLEQAKTIVKAPYSFPPISLLKVPPRSGASGTEEMRENSRRLNETLESFNIAAHIVNVTRGPSVTRYEVELEKGVKLSKLTNCADDIALSLGASGVRIAAVPGKISVVGIEVPNRAVTTVSLREVIDSNEFNNSKGMSTFAVGKDIGGSCIIGNIAKMPHMLIAGTTGSGKSVCMNSIIISLLYKASPEDVKLIMVDPKMVELANYNGIPHLMIPVVTDPKKAAGALQWAVTEMMRRYKTMSDAGVRDLESYNSIVTAEGGDKVPQLIVIIDELADLMMVAAKEVEDSICRIAQMGRASGVHLVIATQRPSADVITGLMKANIPSRIAFSVASAMESRIILDTQGAEKLVGKGDMLFAPIGSGKPLRVQGCFVTDNEVLAVTSYVKEHFVADYDQTVLADIEKKASQTGKKSAPVTAADPEPNMDELEGDELLPQAVDVVLETGQASVSMLQRRLKLGYARAARIVDEMEEKGIVGPFQGSKPRNILVTKEQWESMKASGIQQLSIENMDGDFVHEPEDLPF